LRSGLPFSSRAVIATSDCEAPSWVSTSGVTVITIDVPDPEGPVNGGASWLFMVQAADARHAASTPPVIARFDKNVRIIFKSPETGALCPTLTVA
jgi:hypothetical protein